MARKKKLRPPTLAELRAFREGLAEYVRYEQFFFIGMGWDIVVARWILENYPRATVLLDVKTWAHGYGFDQLVDHPEIEWGEPDAEGMREATYVPWTLVDVKLEDALSAQVDLGQPVLVGTVKLPTGKVTKLLLDGHNRLTKAYALRFPTLPAFVLTEEETEICRIQ